MNITELNAELKTTVNIYLGNRAFSKRSQHLLKNLKVSAYRL